MKSTLLAVLVLAGAVRLEAARILEPATVFYGRIVARVGEREFPITEGQLRWTLVGPRTGDTPLELSATLQPLGDGRYSYRLAVPHEALAYDLTTSGRTLPLTAAGGRLKHVRVLVNGQPATLVAPATDSFTASQATRAAAYRIDLEVPTYGVDSDGDGLPDWWEDAHGTDKWNPADAIAATPTGGSSSNSGSSAYTGTSFAEWRAWHFPGSTGDLAVFGQEDPDHDGLSNLTEYAFDCDPRTADADHAERLPRAELQSDGRFGIVFARRTGASDLDYVVEHSVDLLQWSQPAEAFEEGTVAATSSAPARTRMTLRSPVGSGTPAFLRVRVTLKP